MTLTPPPPGARRPASLRSPRSLEDLLNYRLARLHGASGAPVIRLLEGRYGIARREWAVLALLAARGALAPSALATQLQLDRPRTSRAIGTLVAKGLVSRAAQPGDARRAQVRLTAAGRALYESLFPQVAAHNARVVAVLDDATLDALDRALDALTAQAAALNREQVQDVRADRHAGGRRRPRAGDGPGAGAGTAAGHDGGDHHGVGGAGAGAKQHRAGLGGADGRH